MTSQRRGLLIAIVVFAAPFAVMQHAHDSERWYFSAAAAALGVFALLLPGHGAAADAATVKERRRAAVLGVVVGLLAVAVMLRLYGALDEETDEAGPVPSAEELTTP